MKQTTDSSTFVKEFCKDISDEVFKSSKKAAGKKFKLSPYYIELALYHARKFKHISSSNLKAFQKYFPIKDEVTSALETLETSDDAALGVITIVKRYEALQKDFTELKQKCDSLLAENCILKQEIDFKKKSKVSELYDNARSAMIDHSKD